MTNAKDSTKEISNSESTVIWNEIKDLPLDLFGLPDQTVEKHVFPLNLPGKDLVVKLTASAVLPSLESSLHNMRLTNNKKYECFLAEGYVIIKRAETKESEIQLLLKDQKMKK